MLALVAALLLVVIARSRLGRFLAGLVLLVVIAVALAALPGAGRAGGGAEGRLTALTERAVAMRPALACLEGLAGDAVDSACERALFTQPDTVALALWYTRERLALLAEAGPARNDAADALRRALEADRYGFVAQVLAAQGCTPTDCEALKLFREPATVAANLKSSAYGALVARYAASWGTDLPLAASAALPATVGAVPSAAGIAPPGAPRAGITLPGASAIPPVSIMTEPEPRAPAAAAPPPPPSQAQAAPAAPPAPKKKAAKRPAPPPQPLAPPAAAEPQPQPEGQ